MLYKITVNGVTDIEGYSPHRSNIKWHLIRFAGKDTKNHANKQNLSLIGVFIVRLAYFP